MQKIDVCNHDYFLLILGSKTRRKNKRERMLLFQAYVNSNCWNTRRWSKFTSVFVNVNKDMFLLYIKFIQYINQVKCDFGFSNNSSKYLKKRPLISMYSPCCYLKCNFPMNYHFLKGHAESYNAHQSTKCLCMHAKSRNFRLF